MNSINDNNNKSLALKKPEIDITTMQGWLYKKKSKDSLTLFLAQDNIRWFKIRQFKGDGKQELALCYYDNHRSHDVKGWIYIKDLIEISDDGDSFTLISNQRTFCLRPETPAELKFWLKSLISLCPINCKKNIKCKLYFFILTRGIHT